MSRRFLVNRSVNPAGGVNPPLQPNIGQYGWTSSDAAHVNQLISYVDVAREYAERTQLHSDYVRDAMRDFIEPTLGEIKTIHIHLVAANNGWTIRYNKFQEDYADFLNKYNVFQNDLGEFKINLADINVKYLDIQQRHMDIRTKHAEVEENTKKVEDIYSEMKDGQVYRGIWNPEGASTYPDPENTNSSWDVVLRDDLDSVVFDNKTWQTGNRLIWIKADNAYTQIKTTTQVTSVNGKSGAVTLTHADVGAISISGGTATGAIESPEFNAPLFGQYTQHTMFKSKNAHLKVTDGTTEYGVYSEANKPSAADVGALPTLGNANLNGNMTISGNLTVRGNEIEMANLNVAGELSEKGHRVYSAGNKPSAIEIGALPLTGGTLTGDLIINKPGDGRLKFTDKMGVAKVGNNIYTYAQDGVVFLEGNTHPVAVINGVGHNIYHQGNKPTAADVGALNLGGGAISGRLRVEGVSNEFVGVNTPTREAASYIKSDCNGVPSWFVGKGADGNDNIQLASYVHDNTINLMSDKVLFNKPITTTSGRANLQGDRFTALVMTNSYSPVNARNKFMEMADDGGLLIITRGDDGTNRGVIDLPPNLDGTVYTSGNPPTAAAVGAVSLASQVFNVPGDANTYYLVEVKGYAVYDGFTIARDIHRDYNWSGSLLLNVKGIGKSWGGTVPLLDFEGTQAWGGGVTLNGVLADVRASSTGMGVVYLYLKGGRNYNIHGIEVSATVHPGGVTESDGTSYPGSVLTGELVNRNSFSFRNLDQFISYGDPVLPLANRSNHKVYHEGFKPTAADVGALPLTGGTVQGSIVATVQMHSHKLIANEDVVVSGVGGFANNVQNLRVYSNNHLFIDSAQNSGFYAGNNFLYDGTWKKRDGGHPSGFIAIDPGATSPKFVRSDAGHGSPTQYTYNMYHEGNKPTARDIEITDPKTKEISSLYDIINEMRDEIETLKAALLNKE